MYKPAQTGQNNRYKHVCCLLNADAAQHLLPSRRGIHGKHTHTRPTCAGAPLLLLAPAAVGAWGWPMGKASTFMSPGRPHWHVTVSPKSGPKICYQDLAGDEHIRALVVKR